MLEYASLPCSKSALSAQVEHELTEAMRSAAAPGLAKAGMPCAILSIG